MKAENTILSFGFLVMAAAKYEMIIKAATIIIAIKNPFIVSHPVPIINTFCKNYNNNNAVMILAYES